jgi:hypothetical protein
MLTLSLPASGGSRGPLSRRDFLAVGALPLLGLALEPLLQGAARASEGLAARPPGFGRAKSCAIIWLKGGPSHLDTFDLKPEAPREIRGEFRAIPTSAPGIQLGEHLPRLARVAHRFALLRSMRLSGDAAHSTAAYEMTTGRRFPRSGEAVASRDDHPHHGSVVSALSGRDLPLPPFVMLPDYLVVNGELRGGQNGGVLGGRHDPYVPGGDPRRPGAPGMELAFRSRVEIPRLNDRARLLLALDRRLKAIEGDPELAAVDGYRQKGLSILEKGTLDGVFDLSKEPEATRARYGGSLLGQSTLLLRRLLEAGTRLVQVNCMSTVLDPERNWDTHKNNFATLRDVLLPQLDCAVASLLEDLAASGLLEETLVLVMGEFGRTPRINPAGGRDHWPQCFSVLLAGAGVPGGKVFGASDGRGAAPVDMPVLPGELAATIFHALGIDPAQEIRTFQGRPHRLAEGDPLDLWS